MVPLGRFLRVLNGLPKEYTEGPPRGFMKANPRLHPRPDPWFLAEGLAEDAAEGSS